MSLAQPEGGGGAGGGLVLRVGEEGVLLRWRRARQRAQIVSGRGRVSILLLGFNGFLKCGCPRLRRVMLG